MKDNNIQMILETSRGEWLQTASLQNQSARSCWQRRGRRHCCHCSITSQHLPRKLTKKLAVNSEFCW